MCSRHKCFSQTMVPLLVVAVGFALTCRVSFAKHNDESKGSSKSATLKKLEPKFDNTLSDGSVHNYFVGKGIEAYKQHDFLVAEQFFQIALEDAQSKDLDSLQQAIIMTNLASAQRDAHKYAEADKWFKRALAIARADPVKNKRALEYTANHYIAMLKKSGRNSEAWMLEVSLRDGFKSKKCIVCEENLAKTVKQDNEAQAKAQAAALRQSEISHPTSSHAPTTSPTTSINPAINQPTNPSVNPINTTPINTTPIIGETGPNIAPGIDGQPPQIAGGAGGNVPPINPEISPANNPQNGAGGTALIQQPYGVPVIYGGPVAQMGPGAAPVNGGAHYSSANPVSSPIAPRQGIPLRTPVGAAMFRMGR